jgi:hypothetical protein
MRSFPNWEKDFCFTGFQRLTKDGALKQAHKASATRGRESEMRLELSAAVCKFFENMKFDAKMRALPDADRDWLAELVTLATRCRSYVARNSYNREIEDPGDSEGPGRMMRALTQLWSGLEFIGAGSGRRRELVQKVALDSMPPARRIAFDYLASTGLAGATVPNILRTTHYSQQSIRRALEDLECHEVVVRTGGKPESWSIAAGWRNFSTGLKIKQAAIVSTGRSGGRAGTSAPDDD